MVSSRTASAPPQKKCKKKGLPHYFNATAPFCWAPASGPPFLNFRPGVRARKPISLALQAGGREPDRRKGPGFAPPSSLALIPPSRGANFFLPGAVWRPFWAGSQAQGLLPLPF